MSNDTANNSAFLDLPITFPELETNEQGWSRTVSRQGMIRELLDSWDIDDPLEDSEMAQVLRHLRRQTLALYAIAHCDDLVLQGEDDGPELARRLRFAVNTAEAALSATSDTSDDPPASSDDASGKRRRLDYFGISIHKE